MTAIDEALESLASLNLQEIRSEINKLRGIKKWAMAQLAVDYQPGDRVVIVDDRPSDVGGGWEHYREALAVGQTGIAGEISFNTSSNRWQCLVGMDRTWSVHERDFRAPVRYWNGPAAECPDGYEAVKGENGKVKHFYMDVTWLAKAQP